MHTVFALLCFVVVIHWLIFPYPSGLLHWHCGNLTIAPVPAKQTWWIWINTSCEFIMNDCITTTKQSTTKPCAYLLGYTVGYGRVVTTHNLREHGFTFACLDVGYHYNDADWYLNTTGFVCMKDFSYNFKWAWLNSKTYLDSLFWADPTSLRRLGERSINKCYWLVAVELANDTYGTMKQLSTVMYSLAAVKCKIYVYTYIHISWLSVIDIWIFMCMIISVSNKFTRVMTKSVKNIDEVKLFTKII